jgi:hypothetical protein
VDIETVFANSGSERLRAGILLEAEPCFGVSDQGGLQYFRRRLADAESVSYILGGTALDGINYGPG